MIPLRVLAVADLWLGSNAYAWVRALRRAGHSVRTVPSENYVPGKWHSRPLRAVRRLLEPVLVREYTEALLREARQFRPHLFFVYKGHYVTAEAVRALRGLGAVAVNIYPDVSFLAHGRYLPKALPAYDWVFTTKSFGLADMERQLGIRSASFLPHGYDPEVHRPVELAADEPEKYACEASFVGTWSPKKQRFLEHLVARLPELRLRIWGEQWQPAQATLGRWLQNQPVFGLEYAKAIVASEVNLAILSEIRRGASSGDQITSRTFHIPGCGGFLLHERTEELAAHFQEGAECGAFADPEELAEKVRYFLAHPAERRAIAEAGRRRGETSGYAIDRRAEEVMAKVMELRGILAPGGGS